MGRVCVSQCQSNHSDYRILGLSYLHPLNNLDGRTNTDIITQTTTFDELDKRAERNWIWANVCSLTELLEAHCHLIIMAVSDLFWAHRFISWRLSMLCWNANKFIKGFPLFPTLTHVCLIACKLYRDNIFWQHHIYQEIVNLLLLTNLLFVP